MDLGLQRGISLVNKLQYHGWELNCQESADGQGREGVQGCHRFCRTYKETHEDSFLALRALYHLELWKCKA